MVEGGDAPAKLAGDGPLEILVPRYGDRVPKDIADPVCGLSTTVTVQGALLSLAMLRGRVAYYNYSPALLRRGWCVLHVGTDTFCSESTSIFSKAWPSAPQMNATSAVVVFQGGQAH